jgi:acetate kinase
MSIDENLELMNDGFGKLPGFTAVKQDSSKKIKLLLHVPNHLISCLKSESHICLCHTVYNMRLIDNLNLIFPDLNNCKVKYTYFHLHWNHEASTVYLSLSYTSKSDELN